jgi:hypothetical protein
MSSIGHALKSGLGAFRQVIEARRRRQAFLGRYDKAIGFAERLRRACNNDRPDLSFSYTFRVSESTWSITLFVGERLEMLGNAYDITEHTGRYFVSSPYNRLLDEESELLSALDAVEIWFRRHLAEYT